MVLSCGDVTLFNRNSSKPKCGELGGKLRSNVGKFGDGLSRRPKAESMASIRRTIFFQLSQSLMTKGRDRGLYQAHYLLSAVSVQACI